MMVNNTSKGINHHFARMLPILWYFGQINNLGTNPYTKKPQVIFPSLQFQHFILHSSHIHQSNSTFCVQLISPVFLGKIYSLHLLIILLGMPLLLSSDLLFVFSRSSVPSSLPPFYTCIRCFLLSSLSLLIITLFSLQPIISPWNVCLRRRWRKKYLLLLFKHTFAAFLLISQLRLVITLFCCNI